MFINYMMASVNGQVVPKYIYRQGRTKIKIYRLPATTKPSCNFEKKKKITIYIYITRNILVLFLFFFVHTRHTSDGRKIIIVV